MKGIIKKSLAVTVVLPFLAIYGCGEIESDNGYGETSSEYSRNQTEFFREYSANGEYVWSPFSRTETEDKNLLSVLPEEEEEINQNISMRENYASMTESVLKGRVSGLQDQIDNLKRELNSNASLTEPEKNRLLASINSMEVRKQKISDILEDRKLSGANSGNFIEEAEEVLSQVEKKLNNNTVNQETREIINSTKKDINNLNNNPEKREDLEKVVEAMKLIYLDR